MTTPVPKTAAIIARRGPPLPEPRDGLVVLVHFLRWSYPCVLFSQRCLLRPLGADRSVERWLWHVDGAEDHPAARDRRGRMQRPRMHDCLHDAQGAFLLPEDLLASPRHEVAWWAPLPTLELELPYQAERGEWEDLAESLPRPVLQE